jgi:hypothetical protein
MFDSFHNQSTHEISKESLQPKGLKCVVVGKQNGVSLSSSREDHYIILILPRPREGRVYERVGVGVVNERDVDMQGQGEMVLIV